MTDPSAQSSASNGTEEQEGALAKLLVERNDLRKQLAEARSEVMQLRCRAEILREEWFAARLQGEEYRRYIKKMTGSDPTVAPEEILDAERSPGSIENLLQQLEQGEQLHQAGV